MATWQPKSDEAVGKNEPLGRRLFDEPMLAGANEATSYDGLDLRNFEETRGREFSLDRLGRSGVDNRVSYLLPRAHAAAAKFAVAKTFNGWAVLRTHKLINPPKGARLPVVASPIAGDGLAENLYHAHAILPEGGDAASYSSALHLRSYLQNTAGCIRCATTPHARSRDRAGYWQSSNASRERP